MRRIGEAAPKGDDIGSLLAYRDLAHRALPAVQVGQLRMGRLDGVISPRCVAVPLDALPQLCARTEHAALDLDDLASSSSLWLTPRWQLLWLTDAAENSYL